MVVTPNETQNQRPRVR